MSIVWPEMLPEHWRATHATTAAPAIGITGTAGHAVSVDEYCALPARITGGELDDGAQRRTACRGFPGTRTYLRWTSQYEPSMRKTHLTHQKYHGIAYTYLLHFHHKGVLNGIWYC